MRLSMYRVQRTMYTVQSHVLRSLVEALRTVPFRLFRHLYILITVAGEGMKQIPLQIAKNMQARLPPYVREIPMEMAKSVSEALNIHFNSLSQQVKDTVEQVRQRPDLGEAEPRRKCRDLPKYSAPGKFLSRATTVTNHSFRFVPTARSFSTSGCILLWSNRTRPFTIPIANNSLQYATSPLNVLPSLSSMNPANQAPGWNAFGSATPPPYGAAPNDQWTPEQRPLQAPPLRNGYPGAAGSIYWRSVVIRGGTGVYLFISGL
ncbi:uncharacterized protein LOC129582242 isoform X1 [Paramacrobiotus metropolitanus]|uniref:uncharacterized protein LOC129582242 isoform X1 n=1 Tax=Paramacrobiotus metropolitanus TaxID=2943436 RepID=UPI002445BFC3|nr:uncharacterized protein LOC129582242 isoform X1 [Paramacrobiotus metropolitanus]